MFKYVSSSFCALGLSLFLFSGCSSHDEAMKTLPNELAIADGCRNSNKQFEMDCYDLISYKNSFAQIRLGLAAQLKGNYPEAISRYNMAKQKGNFYVNSLFADLYNNGYGVEKNEDKVVDLLKDVQEVDPIAAYKLAFYYLAKEDNKKAIKLLTFAAENDVKKAQYELGIIYANGEITDSDLEKSTYWKEKFEDNSANFINKIYGI